MSSESYDRFTKYVRLLGDGDGDVQQTKPANMKDLEITLREKYESTKKYKNMCYYDGKGFADRFAAFHRKELIKQNEYILEYEGNNEWELGEYVFEKDDVLYISEHWLISNGATHGLFIFYNDIKDVEKQTSLFAQYYEKGSYFLKRGSRGYYLDKLSLVEEKPPIFEDNLFEKLNSDIDTFFKQEKFYKDNKMTFKRGVLLYGTPGNGKTAFIRQLLKTHTDKFGIIVDCSQSFERDTADFLKYVLDSKPKIIVFEDIDGINEYHRSALLNFLDGVGSVENTFFIATTNHLSRLDSAITNRPSRFDRVFNIGNPKDAVRKELLLRFFPDIEEEMLENCVQESKGFTGAYFKEIFIFSNIQKCTPLEAIETLKTQLKVYKDFGKEYMG